jgi:hypothetical protein
MNVNITSNNNDLVAQAVGIAETFRKGKIKAGEEFLCRSNGKSYIIKTVQIPTERPTSWFGKIFHFGQKQEKKVEIYLAGGGKNFEENADSTNSLSAPERAVQQGLLRDANDDMGTKTVTTEGAKPFIEFNPKKENKEAFCRKLSAALESISSSVKKQP